MTSTLVATLAFVVATSTSTSAQDRDPAAEGVATANEAESLPAPVETRFGRFVPTRFADLDGWGRDNPSEAWNALLESCRALGTRSAWNGLCRRARSVDLADEGAARSFFEREFFLFQVQDRNRSAAGVITGYYEALLNGSRTPSGRNRFPVLGRPDDLLLLDARSVPPSAGVVQTYARVDGKRVIPLPQIDDAAWQPGAYLLDLKGAHPDVRDKLLRVRIEQSRIVPYFTRAEIDAGRLASAPVLAWVDDAAALYSMQVQGAGKIRLDDGGMLRVAFAEQNGHPFVPPVQRTGNVSRPRPLLRGFPMPSATDAENAGGDAPATARTRSLGPQNEGNGGITETDEQLSPEVAHMVDLLLGNIPDEPGSAVSRPAEKQARARPVAAAVSAAPAPMATGDIPQIAGDDPRKAFANDPSYVFFREIADAPGGPVGALGVPLTPERSVAVDPRTTPLGYPVFIATEPYGGEPPVHRLVFAQDTGGAIRGAVRADYFYGFGTAAYERASRMRQLGRMWLLVPREQPLAVNTRGFNGSEHDCLVPDADFCVE